jgi:hypothetical protein
MFLSFYLSLYLFICSACVCVRLLSLSLSLPSFLMPLQNEIAPDLSLSFLS